MPTKPKHWSDRLPADTCAPARKWARGKPSLLVAWVECERADWMLWLVGRLAPGDPTTPERRRLAGATAACARVSLPAFEAALPGDNRVRRCIETVERWAANDPAVTMEMVQAAAAESAAAARSLSAWSAASARSAAESASELAWSSSAASAWSVAESASELAWSAASAASASKQLADLVREHYPKPPKLKAVR